jgi:predicted helicase
VNFENKVLEKIKTNLKSEVKPEDILDYIYAVLYSPTYREKYKEFLKIDFPRIPYPKNNEIFWKLVEKGKELRLLHLMESPKLREFITTFLESGSNIVEKVKYEDGKVFINDTQYFGNVPEIAWNFYIGGYQPAQKWLKDRKGRTLSNEDLEHYQKIIVALFETERIIREINKIKIE